MAIRGAKPLPLDLATLLKPGFERKPSVDLGRPPGGAGAGDNAGYIEPPRGEMVPSAKLRANPDALTYFEFYKRTAGFGHLKEVDQPLLEMLCFYLATFDRTLEEYLSSASLVQKSMAGIEVPSPYFQYMTKLGEVIRKYCMELAFTPIERARLKNVSPQGPAEMAKENKRKEMHAKYLSGHVDSAGREED